jgi:hypothetical protein
VDGTGHAGPRLMLRRAFLALLTLTLGGPTLAEEWPPRPQSARDAVVALAKVWQEQLSEHDGALIIITSHWEATALYLTGPRLSQFRNVWGFNAVGPKIRIRETNGVLPISPTEDLLVKSMQADGEKLFDRTPDGPLMEIFLSQGDRRSHLQVWGGIPPEPDPIAGWAKLLATVPPPSSSQE